jgi:DeoR/GlpR family transcriptional regulator of sugar metabolism
LRPGIRPEVHARLPAEARRVAVTELLRRAGSVTVAELSERFRISPMTARRDLCELEREGLALRTHGGAVVPVTTDRHLHAARTSAETAAQASLADAAVKLLAPRQSVFLDPSPISYLVARRIVRDRLAMTVLTNSQPVMHLVATSGDATGLELIGIGGTLRRSTRAFVGPFALRGVSEHFADWLFLSVNAITADGMLIDSESLEAEVKRAMLAHADRPVVLLEPTGVSVGGHTVIGRVAQLAEAIAHGMAATELAPLRAAGVTVRQANHSEPSP